jgi:hypothetical protein
MEESPRWKTGHEERVLERPDRLEREAHGPITNRPQQTPPGEKTNP